MQALRLFVHYPFLVRASHYCRTANRAALEPAGALESSDDCLRSEAIRTCLRGQTFFSIGLRFLYMFIPLVRPGGKHQQAGPPSGTLWWHTT